MRNADVTRVVLNRANEYIQYWDLQFAREDRSSRPTSAREPVLDRYDNVQNRSSSHDNGSPEPMYRRRLRIEGLRK